MSVKNDGRKTENGTINFRFLDPDDEATKRYGQPLLDKLIEHQAFAKVPEGLKCVGPSQSKEIPPGPKNGTVDFYGKINVKQVRTCYVCVEVELSVKDEVKESEHDVLVVFDPDP